MQPKLFSNGIQNCPTPGLPFTEARVADYYLSGRLEIRNLYTLQKVMQSHTARVINMFILLNPGNLNLEIHPKKISQLQKKKLKKNP